MDTERASKIPTKLIARILVTTITTLPLLGSSAFYRESSQIFPYFVSPVISSRITSPFGERLHPITGQKSFHAGVDIAAPKASVVRAVQSGTIIFSGYASGYGECIAIRHKNGLVTLYAHLKKRLLKVGEKIPTGAVIGQVGSTGRSTGPHLHFEVRRNGRPMDPAQALPFLTMDPLG